MFWLPFSPASSMIHFNLEFFQWVSKKQLLHLFQRDAAGWSYSIQLPRISLLQVISKDCCIFVEISARKTTHLKFRFCHGQSREYQLVKAVSDWSSNKDNNVTTVADFINFSTAIDRMKHHSILLYPPQLRLGGSALNCFDNYLYNRN